MGSDKQKILSALSEYFDAMEKLNDGDVPGSVGGFPRFLISSLCEQVFEWKKWMKEIPFIKWPADWEVKAIPPFAAAIIRYQVKTPKHPSISIYLDGYSELGLHGGGPYWEVYDGDDVHRCDMDDTKQLLEIIGACKKPL